MDKLTLQPAQIRLRHIKLGASTDPGAVSVLGQYLAPQDRKDVNDRRSRFRTGSYVRREGQEGEFSLRFWNTPRNRKRFNILTNRSSYQPGDEWIEIWETTGEDAAGDLLFVGTPTKCDVTLTTITLTGYDGFWMLRKQRETDAGFFCHAPRDIFEHYCRAWTCPLADDFTTTGRFTYSTSPQTTADGAFTYLGADEDASVPSSVRITGIASATAYVRSTVTIPDGATESWRAETNIAKAVFNAALSPIYLFVGQAGAGGTQLNLTFTPTWAICQTVDSGGSCQVNVPGPNQSLGDKGFPMTLAIEKRERWAFFYISGLLVATLPIGTLAGPLVVEVGTNAGANTKLWCDSLLLRQTRSHLQRAGIGGDLRLPSSTLPVGGLKATFFDDHDLIATDPTNGWKRSLEPTRDKQGAAIAPVPSRLDAQITFANAAAFNVPVANNECFSARWTGAIYLDLDNYDYAFRTTADDRARVWIGKTRLGEQIINDWTSGHTATTTTSTWVKAGSSAGSAPSGTSGPLAAQKTGWYPIVIEYGQNTGTGSLVFEQERSDAVGTWATPAATNLSPYGIESKQVRGDSHYEQLLALKASWALQFTCAPKSLESGEFPGRMIPVVREGRDVDVIVDGFDGSNPQTSINAEDVASTLRCDAQGIADPKGASQLTREAIDFTQVTKHMVVNSEYESLSDITYAPLLEQRARSLLALRSSPFEEIQVQPSGKRGLTDTFPLTGALAKMNWLPGDGARLRLAELGVEDLSPRQMIEITWPVKATGRGRPSVTWRQRVRNWEQLFRKTARVGLNNDRNYQSQLAIITGSIGVSGAAGGSDAYTRVPLPASLSDVKRATLVVLSITGTWTIEINGTSTGLTVSAAGRYDVSQYIAKVAATQQMYARLITGGTVYQIQLELLIAT